MLGANRRTAMARSTELDDEAAPKGKPSKSHEKADKQPKPDRKVAPDSVDPAADIVFQIGTRNEYYRDSYRKAWKLLYLLTAALVCSLIMNMWLMNKEHIPLPIAVTPDGRVFEVTPLTEPVLGPDGIRQWAGRTIPAMYNMNFRDYQDQIASMEPFFTPEGFKGYLQAIQRYRLIEAIRANNYIASAAVTAAPQVTETKVVNGRRQWLVKVPIVVTYDNGINPVNQQLMVTAIIVRAPESQNPFGLSIHSFASGRK